MTKLQSAGVSLQRTSWLVRLNTQLKVSFSACWPLHKSFIGKAYLCRVPMVDFCFETAAIRFFNDVAAVAEAEGHHPDLHLTGYRNVEVVLSTHVIGGLSMFDFVVASKLDAIDVDYSPKWLRDWQSAHPSGNE